MFLWIRHNMPFVIEKDVDYYDEVGTKLTLLKLSIQIERHSVQISITRK